MTESAKKLSKTNSVGKKRTREIGEKENWKLSEK